MTVSSIKVKVVRKPTIKTKVGVHFPANVQTRNFLTVTKANGIYTFSVDYSVLTPGPISDPTSAFIAILDQAAGIYKEVSLSSLLTSGLDADLQAIAALTGTGILSRTASNTWALRTLTAPAAGLTITNPDGVSGNETFALANDLAALEGLASTGIARRTGTDAWSVGTAVTNAELATAAAFTLKGNATGSAATPTDIDVTALTTKASPVAADIILIHDSAASNAFKKTTVGAVVGSAGVSSYNGLSGAVAGFTADKAYFVSTAGNDSNNGLSRESAKLTLQAAITAASPNGTVYAGTGTFTLTTALLMQPGVKLVGSPGTIITQGTAANLAKIIDFSTNSANGAAIEGCTIDGNRANNTDNDSVYGVYIGAANDVRLERNKFLNMNGTAVNVSDGLRPIVRFNDFQNFMTMGIAASATSTAIDTNGQFSWNTFSNQLGQHVIYIAKSNGNQIIENRIIATQIIGNATATAPHTITWVSGTDFTGLKAGGFVVMSPGGVATEYHITSVNSNTSLTVFETVTAQTNAAFIVGTGDIINIGNSTKNRVAGNDIRYGASGAVVLHNFYGGQSLLENIVENNQIYYAGGSGISVQSTSTVSPATFASDTTIQNNRIVSAGMGGAAVGALGKNAISAIDFAPTTLGSLIIQGNRLQNEGGLSTMDWGIYLSGVSAGQVYAGNNTSFSLTNSGIFGGISSVTLSAGWGTTASVTNIIANGNSMTFFIVPGGTGIAATPTITVNTRATSLTQPPQYQTKAYDNTGAVCLFTGDLEHTATASALSMAYFGTPTSGRTVILGING